MEKCKGFNIYVKDGKAFGVVQTQDGKAISINMGLIEYALKHARPVKESKNGKN